MQDFNVAWDATEHMQTYKAAATNHMVSIA